MRGTVSDSSLHPLPVTVVDQLVVIVVNYLIIIIAVYEAIRWRPSEASWQVCFE